MNTLYEIKVINPTAGEDMEAGGEMSDSMLRRSGVDVVRLSQQVLSVSYQFYMNSLSISRQFLIKFLSIFYQQVLSISYQLSHQFHGNLEEISILCTAPRNC